MPLPISVCMISREDPHLDKCIESVKDHVAEICVVITSDTDTLSEDICKKHNVKFTTFTDCNIDGKIVDFSLARNKSLSLATQPWCMWIDSDDLIVGLDTIEKLIQTPDNVMFLFPYEYSYNDKGVITCRQYRERLFKNNGSFKFIGPVHEVLVPDPSKQTINVQSDLVTFKHQRQFNPKMQDPGRNLRILKNYFDTHDKTDALYVRNMYYIGLEYSNNNDIANAVKNLTEYVKVSGWSDEVAMAYIKLVDISQNTGDFTTGLDHAFNLLKVKYNWFESYYALCRMYYFLNKMHECVHYGKLALSCPKTETLLFVDQAARFEISLYLNVALNNLSDVKGALECCQIGLVGLPNHPQLINNMLRYESHLGIKREREKFDGVVFVTNSIDAWSPESVAKTGIGGSEMMLINQAKNLAKLGHNVRVYAAADGKFDNVEYKHVNSFRDIECNVLIVSRYCEFLSDTYNVAAKLKLLWVHDIFAHGANNALLLKADKILALTEWHKQQLIQAHNVHPDHVIVTRNGIDLTRFHNLKQVDGKWTSAVERDQYKCINSSSPDRSWPVLLECWPEIKKAVPQASLHLFYGFNNWKIMCQHDPVQTAAINDLEKAANTMDGVVFHGRVNQDELAKEFLSAGVWTFPTHFAETSCISAMEAQRAGCHVITTSLAALKETVIAGTLLTQAYGSKEYKDAFIAATIKALNTKERIYNGTQFGLVELAQRWDGMFKSLIEDKKTNPINKYQPTRMYKKKAVSKYNKLNIGCGTSVFPFDGWTNVDHADFTGYFNFIQSVQHSTGMPDHQKKLWEFARNGGEIKYEKHDMTKPFTMFDDNSFDFIYLGQCIEHLHYFTQAPALMKECHRMMKTGGIVRLATPDFNKLLRAYNADEMDKFNDEQPAFYKELPKEAQLQLIMFGASGDNCTQQNYEGHFFNYTETTMIKLLTDAGFKDVSFTWPKCGKNKEIAEEVEDFGFSHSLIAEAVK